MTDIATGVPVQKPRQTRMTAMDAIQLQKMYATDRVTGNQFCTPLAVGYCQEKLNSRIITLEDFRIQCNAEISKIIQNLIRDKIFLNCQLSAQECHSSIRLPKNVRIVFVALNL